MIIISKPPAAELTRLERKKDALYEEYSRTGDNLLLSVQIEELLKRIQLIRACVQQLEADQ